jgi:hypothetical protein
VKKAIVLASCSGIYPIPFSVGKVYTNTILSCCVYKYMVWERIEKLCRKEKLTKAIVLQEQVNKKKNQL